MYISKITETIFNSSLANFKISVECTAERGSNSGPQPLVTVSDRGVCSIESSIYLVFSYKGDRETTKNLYMSYPQIPQLINLMSPIAEAVSKKAGEEGSAYGYIDNTLVVHPNYAEPACLANIGKRMMGLSVRAILADLNGSNGTSSNDPAVEIRITDPEKSTNDNALSSVLSVDEYLNIVHQIKTLNLTELNAIFSLFYLQSKMMGGNVEVSAPRYNNYRPQFNGNNYNNNYNNNGFQQNNYQGNNYQHQGSPTPRYNNNNANRTYDNNRQPQQVRQAAPAQSYHQQPVVNNYSNNNYNSSAQQPVQQKIMNNRDIESTPISTITFDDTEEIDQLFGED